MSTTTVLEIARKACRRLGQGVPSALVGSNDESAAQLLQLLEEAGRYCFERGTWEIGIGSTTITTVAAEEQCTLATAIPDLDYLVLDEAYYSQDTSTPVDVSVYGGKLYIKPAPPAGQELVLFYQKKAWLLAASDAAPIYSIQDDGDIVLLDEEMVILALKASWRQAKGLDATMDFVARERSISDRLIKDGLKRTLFMDSETRSQYPAGTINLYHTIS